MPSIVIWGDSIVYGTGVAPGLNWADQLKAEVMAKNDPNGFPTNKVYSLGIGGETTQGALARFQQEAQARLSAGDTIILAYGANDSALLTDTQQFAVPQDAYSENLSRLIDVAQDFQPKQIIVVAVTPVLEEQTRPEMGSKVRLNQYVVSYNQVLAHLAKKSHLLYADVYTEMMQQPLTLLFQPDGIHPNEAGHHVIYRTISQLVNWQ